MDFRGNAPGQVSQRKVIRTIKDVENFSDFFSKLLGDLALLADELGCGFVLGDKFSRGLFVDNAGLDAVDLLGFVNCIEKKPKKSNKIN